MANSIDPDEMAHYEPSHLDLCCLQISVKASLGMNGQALKNHALLDASFRVKPVPDQNAVAIPLRLPSDSFDLTRLREKIDTILVRDLKTKPSCIEYKLEHLELTQSKKSLLKTPAAILRDAVVDLLRTKGLDWNSDIEADLPTHWEKHGSLVLLPDTAFNHEIWSEIDTELWPLVCDCLQAKRLAKKTVISSDGFRTPQVTLLHGESGWVQHTDNGVMYSYNITRCMFSAGNISEKLRVANFRCQGKTVVDLYAGIGYFTLPYLVHSGAAYVHACEWNPNAVEALRRNLDLNGVAKMCTVYHGDNRKVCPKGVADRVNLGLVPSSEPGWYPACSALKPGTGGILHIHGNVESKVQGQSELLSHCPAGQGSENRSTSKLSEPCDVKNDDLSVEHPPHQTVTATSCTCPNRECDQHMKNCSSDPKGGTASCHSYTKTGMLDADEVNKETGKVDKVTVSSQSRAGPSETKVCVTGATNGSQLKTIRTHNDRCQTLSENFGSESQENELNDSSTQTLQLQRRKKQEKWSKQKQADPAWISWSKMVAEKVRGLLMEIHGSDWQTNILHIEHVKSYAPHVSHLVLDLECRPSFC